MFLYKGGQRDGKAGTLSVFAFHIDLTLMFFYDVFDNGQAQSSTAPFAAAALIYPVEPFKNAAEVFRWNAYAGIPDCHIDVVTAAG